MRTAQSAAASSRESRAAAAVSAATTLALSPTSAHSAAGDESADAGADGGASGGVGGCRAEDVDADEKCGAHAAGSAARGKALCEMLPSGTRDAMVYGCG